jgi:hypothetical protein
MNTPASAAEVTIQKFLPQWGLNPNLIEDATAGFKKTAVKIG